jgi:tetratricopeptide (TPR) repeat protein
LFRTCLASGTQKKIINVTGLAGIGKSTLVEEFAAVARDSGACAAIVNARTLTSDPSLSMYPAAVQALTVLERETGQNRRKTRTLTRRLARYAALHWEVQRKFSVEERPAVTTILQFGAAAVRAGSTVLPVAKPLDAILTPELVTKLSEYISSFRRESDRLLLINPVQQLTELFVAAMNSPTSPDQRLVLVFDEFELASHPLEHWLRQLVAGRYGEFDNGLLAVVAGRKPLGQDWLARGNTIDVTQMSLERFTALETEEYLRSNVPSLDSARARELTNSLAEVNRIPLILRLLTAQPKFVASLSSDGPTPNLSLLQNELVDRLLDDPTVPVDYRDMALRLSVARSFDVHVLTVIGEERDLDARIALIAWLVTNGFVNAQVPAYAYYDLLRGAFLEYLNAVDADLVIDLHRRLAEYYQSRLSVAPPSGEVHRELPTAVAYHRLSMLPGNLLAAALQLLFEYLPTAYEDCATWSRVLEQVVQERHGVGKRETSLLHRLATVLASTYALTVPAPAHGRMEEAEPAVNMLFASSFDDSWPTVSDQDAEIWLTYFESRLKIITGGVDDLAVALQELRRCWAQLESFDPQDERTTHLRFRLASELADIYSRRSDLGTALTYLNLAVRAARQDGSSTREAFSLYKLSNNYKRQGKYNLGLRSLNKAITLIETVRSRSAPYYRGRLLLDKAITLTYMNEVADARNAYEESRRCFASMSPSIYAELSHRIGWLKRVSGDLTGAIHDHEIAVSTLRGGAVVLESGTAISGTSYPLARSLHSMGNVYVEMCRHEEALACFKEAQELFRRQGGTRHEAIVRKDRAWSLFQLHGAGAAEDDLLRSVADLDFHSELPTRPAVNSATHLAEAWLNLSVVRSCVGSFADAGIAVDLGIRVLAGDKDNRQLVHRLDVQRALVDACLGADSPEPCREATKFALSHTPVLYQIVADAVLVRAALSASLGNKTEQRRWYEAAQEEAARWNEFAPHALAERWQRLSVYIEPSLPSTPARLGADDMTITSTRPMVTTDEMLDVYDAQGNLLGQASKPLVHTVGLWHRTFHCWIVRQRADGQWVVVLQQRGPGTRTYPHYLDISVAGHYQAGEGIEGGLRECAEELGITGSRDQLRLIARRVVDETGDGDTINRELQDI